MGQPVTVVHKPSAKPGVARFEINRSITGMGHERYRSDREVSGDRPCDVLAQRLFAFGAIEGVHVNSNVITLDVKGDIDVDAVSELIGDLFTYYRPGVEIPVFETEDA